MKKKSKTFLDIVIGIGGLIVFWLVAYFFLKGGSAWLGEVLIIWVAFPCTLLATIRLLLLGTSSFPNHIIINFLSSKNWCFFLFIILPYAVGGFGYNELSPLPWRAFTDADGFAEGVSDFLQVCIADLWLLLVPAHIYANRLMYNNDLSKDEIHLEKLEKEKVRLVRIINVLVGLLLMTPNNPLSKLVDFIFQGEPS
jgi:hypothetical protein